MIGARRAGNALVHQGAAQVVGTRRQAGGHARLAHLHPRHLDIVDQPVQHQPRHRVHQHRFPEGGAPAGPAAQVHGRLHVHEGQRHELGKAAGALLQPAHQQQVARPVPGLVYMTVHDGGRGGQARIVGRLYDLQPLVGTELVGAQFPAHLVVQHLGGGTRQRGQPRLPEPGQENRRRHPQGRGPLGHLQG